MKKISALMLNKRRVIALISAVLSFTALAVMPFFATKIYYIHVLIMCMIYACITSVWNLIAGYAGVFSFGFQALFGTGAYVSALLSIYFGWSPWFTMWIGAFSAMCVGSVVAIPSLKLKALPYICIATMCMGEIIRIIASNLTDITRGELGLSQIPKLFTENIKINSYYLILAMLVATLLLVTKIVNSPMGMSLKAMKDSQEASESLGINIAGTKIRIYMIGAFVAGAVGAFYAHYMNILTPTSVLGTSLMTQYVAMSLIGGMGTIVGPLFGSFLITISLELLRGLDDYRLIIYALLIIVAIIFMRNGIWGTLKEFVLSRCEEYRRDCEQKAKEK
ncbi:MAG: branched-chain amino acid ABC transporter permease [Oscillospiraceae bacterium]|nr:branched-chain amino acid ABC transporter permease [Oscillospiraceae bacterium]